MTLGQNPARGKFYSGSGSSQWKAFDVGQGTGIVPEGRRYDLENSPFRWPEGRGSFAAAAARTPCSKPRRVLNT